MPSSYLVPCIKTNEKDYVLIGSKQVVDHNKALKRLDSKNNWEIIKNYLCENEYLKAYEKGRFNGLFLYAGGRLAFLGGRKDRKDKNSKATAIREFKEEAQSVAKYLLKKPLKGEEKFIENGQDYYRFTWELDEHEFKTLQSVKDEQNEKWKNMVMNLKKISSTERLKKDEYAEFSDMQRLELIPLEDLKTVMENEEKAYKNDKQYLGYITGEVEHWCKQILFVLNLENIDFEKLCDVVKEKIIEPDNQWNINAAGLLQSDKQAASVNIVPTAMSAAYENEPINYPDNTSYACSLIKFGLFAVASATVAYYHKELADGLFSIKGV